MKSVKVFHYDAFSSEPNKGNPAGVVFDGDHLSDEEMQQIAFNVGFNETTFPVESEAADLRLRYFTPGHEMNLCGHATMAAIYALKTRGSLANKERLTIETKAGILPVTLHENFRNEISITMKQASPQFEKFNGSKKELANAIGLHESDLNHDLPILYGSTGIWTLLIPVQKLDSFKKMKPDTKGFPAILKEMPKVSIHPFCMETYDSNAAMHARHFSSPYSGTIEDAVTGTASGVMGAYYVKYIKSSINKPIDLVVEQGHEIGKNGRVFVRVSNSEGDLEVEVSGTANFVKEFEVVL